MPFVVTVAVSAAFGCGGTVAGQDQSGSGGSAGSGGGGDPAGVAGADTSEPSGDTGGTGGVVGGTGGYIPGLGGCNPPPCPMPTTTTCPTLMPIEGSVCSYVGAGCEYGPVCYDGVAEFSAACVNDAWHLIAAPCNPPPFECPPEAPSAGTACSDYALCLYEVDDCEADGGGWFNEVSADCFEGQWRVERVGGIRECTPPDAGSDADVNAELDGGSD
jgi:hypothetical protein